MATKDFNVLPFFLSEVEDELKICKFFRDGRKCWLGNRCPYKHIRLAEGKQINIFLYMIDCNLLVISHLFF